MKKKSILAKFPERKILPILIFLFGMRLRESRTFLPCFVSFWMVPGEHIKLMISFIIGGYIRKSLVKFASGVLGEKTDNYINIY